LFVVGKKDLLRKEKRKEKRKAGENKREKDFLVISQRQMARKYI